MRCLSRKAMATAYLHPAAAQGLAVMLTAMSMVKLDDQAASCHVAAHHLCVLSRIRGLLET